MNFLTENIETTYIYITEIAQLIRDRLDMHFTGVKFTVSTNSDRRYIEISWVDGPSEAEVRALTAVYNHQNFILYKDGFASLQEFNSPRVYVHRSSYISIELERLYSAEFVERAIEDFSHQYGVKPELSHKEYMGGRFESKYRITQAVSFSAVNSDTTFVSHWTAIREGKTDIEFNDEKYREYARAWEKFIVDAREQVENPAIKLFEPLKG